MNVREEVHLLIERLDGSKARQLLHTLVDDMHEEQARETLSRMRDLRRPFLEKFGFDI